MFGAQSPPQFITAVLLSIACAMHAVGQRWACSRYGYLQTTNLAIKWACTIIFCKNLFAFLLLFRHEASLARAFPVSPVYVDGRKSCLRTISTGCMQKPRRAERVQHPRRASTSATTLQSARYRASKLSKVMTGLGVPKICIAIIVFVVKTTRKRNVAPFDALDDICRPRTTTPDGDEHHWGEPIIAARTWQTLLTKLFFFR